MKKINIFNCRIAGLGMRSIKTGIAVALCALGGVFWQMRTFLQTSTLDRMTVFACAAAIVCLRESIENSLKFGALRLAGTGIGGAVGIAFLYLKRERWLIVPLTFIGVVLCIFFCNRLRIADASALSCIVFCIVLMTDMDTTPYLYALFRIASTAVGVIVAVSVNMLLRPYASKTDTSDKEKPEQEALLAAKSDLLDDAVPTT